jgi:carbamoyl-phosphate synthase small subunit
MTGYQEVLTDPSYFGQIVTMTYPLIGNYGTNLLDAESRQPFVRGFVVEELSPIPSNWRSERGLAEYLAEWNVIGIQGIDTRSLTKHLRVRGAMKGCLTTELDAEAAVKRAQEGNGVVGMDFVREVTTPSVFSWDPDDSLSPKWKLATAGSDPALAHTQGDPLPPADKHVVAYDLGMKYNILRRLRQHGMRVTVVPATTTAEEALALNPDGIFLSNGPGDPGSIPYVHEAVRGLIGKKPIFGICLGHQVLGYALGGSTFKLKFGHRGGNQPVQDLRTGLVAITSQNHGFAVAEESLPAHAEVTHINLNDRTVEGLRHRSEPVFSVQYHPEAAPGPHDATYFFRQFANLIDGKGDYA